MDATTCIQYHLPIIERIKKRKEEEEGKEINPTGNKVKFLIVLFRILKDNNDKIKLAFSCMYQSFSLFIYSFLFSGPRPMYSNLHGPIRVIVIIQIHLLRC